VTEAHLGMQTILGQLANKRRNKEMDLAGNKGSGPKSSVAP